MPLGMHAPPLTDAAAVEGRAAQRGAAALPPSALSGGGAFGYSDSELERRIADELAAIDFGATREPTRALTLSLTLTLTLTLTLPLTRRDARANPYPNPNSSPVPNPDPHPAPAQARCPSWVFWIAWGWVRATWRTTSWATAWGRWSRTR